MQVKDKNLILGISIIELSISILIISLLIGLITSGIKINKASQLRDVMSKISSYQVAIENFKSKYQQLPGDFDNAFSYWNFDCASDANHCNGDNNGKIETTGNNYEIESFRAWQHLNLAGLVDGGYTGIGSGTGIQADIGINVPSTIRDKGGFFIASFKNTDDINYAAGDRILVGAFLQNNLPLNKLFSPAEAFSIDSKIDDGIADRGKVKGRYYNSSSWNNLTCITGTHPNRDYNKTRKNDECVLYFSINP